MANANANANANNAAEHKAKLFYDVPSALLATQWFRDYAAEAEDGDGVEYWQQFKTAAELLEDVDMAAASVLYNGKLDVDDMEAVEYVCRRIEAKLSKGEGSHQDNLTADDVLRVQCWVDNTTDGIADDGSGDDEA